MLLWLGAAYAGTIIIDARVDDRLRWIEGTMAVSGEPVYTVVDPLAALPDAPNDRFVLRSWPGAAEKGWVRFERIGDGRWSFHALLPKRFGDVGKTRHGLFANGFWYPQVLGPDGVGVHRWVVQVQGPEDAVMAVGDVVGRGVVRWSGRGERASLAVVPKGEPVALSDDVVLVTRGRARRALSRTLSEQVEALSEELPLAGTIVEAPLRRRLTRAGRRMTYVSDRAYRVTPFLRRAHKVGVARGLLSGLAPRADPFTRAWTAGALAQHYADDLRGLSAQRVLALGSWNPVIYAVMYDRRMPFVSEMLEEVHLDDPMRDDLLEVFDPHVDGPVVAAQLDAAFGPGTALTAARSVVRGRSTPDALLDAGAPPDWLAPWRGPYPVQDYRLTVGDTVLVERVTDDDALSETLVVEIDDVRHTWSTGTGPGTHDFGPGKKVVLDPDGLVRQTDSLGDRQPPRWTATAYAWLDSLNLTRLYLEGTAATWLRRTNDTHNLYGLQLWSDRQDLYGGRASYIYRFGPRVDGLSREHATMLSVSGARLNPGFSDIIGGKSALDFSARWGWDTRVSDLFPLEGQRAGLRVSTGFSPDGDARWSSGGGSLGATVSPHPRHALAVMGRAGSAVSDVPHRLADLGGQSALRSVPPGTVLVTHHGLAMTEYRYVPLRDLNTPLLVGWASEIQLSAGAEVGVGQRDTGPVVVEGLTTGVTYIGEILGVSPGLIGVTAAWPLGVTGTSAVETGNPLPEIYIRWWQEF